MSSADMHLRRNIVAVRDSLEKAIDEPANNVNRLADVIGAPAVARPSDFAFAVVDKARLIAPFFEFPHSFVNRFAESLSLPTLPPLSQTIRNIERTLADSER